MTDIQIFNHEDFGGVRVVEIDGQPFFVGADVANALGYKNHRDALAKHVDDEDKRASQIATPSGVQTMIVINESGVYSLILRSNLPKAKEFKRWVTSEVLPTIRKTGFYINPNAPVDPDLLIKIGQQLKDAYAERDQLQGKVALLQPKADYCDKVLSCEDLLRVTEIAKDYGLSAIEFNQLLKEHAIQYKLGKTWFLYAKFAKLGWAQSKTQTFNDKNGSSHSIIQLYWTQKGRKGLYDFLKERGIVPTAERDPHTLSLF